MAKKKRRKKFSFLNFLLAILILLFLILSTQFSSTQLTPEEFLTQIKLKPGEVLINVVGSVSAQKESMMITGNALRTGVVQINVD